MEKLCARCNNIKPISEFNKDTSRKDGFYHTCKECRKCIRTNTKDKIKERSKKYYNNNKSKLLLKNKLYRMENSEILSIKHRKYYQNNRAKLISNNVQYERDKLKHDSNLRLYKNLRRRISSALSHNYKSESTMDLIGCDITTLKNHLQSTAISNGYINFNIETYNGYEYHIDHIIPCCYFDLSDPEQQRICFNYKNLQILTSYDNLLKGGRHSKSTE